MKNIIYLLLVTLLMSTVHGAISNVTVEQLTDNDYSDVWLGVSTGGYALLAEKDGTFVFRVFVKNGMNDRSLHNLKLHPRDFPFEVNSIVPRSFEQIKPMEIVICSINITVPEEARQGKYQIFVDISSDEFPKGVFSLESEIKVVKRVRTEVYVTYLLISLGLLALLLYRKKKL